MFCVLALSQKGKSGCTLLPLTLYHLLVPAAFGSNVSELVLCNAAEFRLLFKCHRMCLYLQGGKGGHIQLRGYFSELISWRVMHVPQMLYLINSLGGTCVVW